MRPVQAANGFMNNFGASLKMRKVTMKLVDLFLWLNEKSMGVFIMNECDEKEVDHVVVIIASENIIDNAE